jgi:multicomponent Na+:H+ antiporter subunit D
MRQEARVLAITLNPGFICILAALLVLASPRAFRAPIIVGAAALALWLMLDRDFGAVVAAQQMGLPVVVLDLDALNRIFGIAMLLALIIIGLCTSARRNRSEDAAILVLAGGSVSALFVGDMVSFVAAASLAGLAAAWVTFASPLPGAAQSGARLLIWFALEGLLFLVGVAFQLSAGAGSSIFSQLEAASLGGGFIFAALLFRAGAPLAHVWLKDAVGNASPVGAGALGAFSTMLGVYGLARLFPAEPVLLPIGVAMIVIGAFYAMAEDDLRRAGASGLTAQTGVCMMLIGIGSPLALAAAEGHAFTVILAFLALHLAFGAVLGRQGEVNASQLTGLARTMPISATLMAVAGLAVAGAPGLATYVTSAIALEALAQWQAEPAWIAAAATQAALFVALMLRPTLQAFRVMPGPAQRNEAPFPMLLGVAVAVFFCVSIGLAPGWLYGLLPAEPAFPPYEIQRTAPQLELLGAAGAGFILLRALRLTPRERAVRILDVDALYRGPAAGAGRWFGVVLLRLYGTWRALWARMGERTAHALDHLTRSCDRPYRGGALGSVQFLALAIAIAVALMWPAA